MKKLERSVYALYRIKLYACLRHFLQSDLSRAVISLAIASDYTYLVYLVSLCSRDVMALNNYIQPQCLFCLLRALDKVGNHFCLPSQVYLSVGKVLQHQVDSSTSALNHFHLLSHSS